MRTNKEYDLDSWKCGKGRAFTHIPTNFFILPKINSSISHKGNRGEKV